MSAQIAERLERVRSYGERRFALGPGVVWSYTPELGTGLNFPLKRLGYRVRLSGPTGAVEAFLTYVNPTAQEQEALFMFPLERDVVPLKVKGKYGDTVLESRVGAAPPEDGDDLREVVPQPLANLFQSETERILALPLGMVPPGAEINFQIMFACFNSESGEDGCGFSFRLPLMVSQSLTTLREDDAESLQLAPGLERGAQVAISLQLEASDLNPGRLITSQPCAIARNPNGDIAVEFDRRKSLEPRDFVFDYQLWNEDQPKAWLRSQGRHFLLNFLPPAGLDPDFPRRIVFLVDGSEEMKRLGVERVHSCIGQVLRSLGAADRFALVAFNRDVGGFKNGDFVEPSLGTEALDWLHDFDFSGVADLKVLLERVVTLPRQPDSVLSVVVLAAGRLGNEPELYRVLQGARENLRLVPVLLGRNADAHFARAASKLTGGRAFRALTEESISRVADRIVEETRRSVLEVVGLQDRGLGFQGDSLTPKYPCGLSAYRPINIMGLHTSQGGVEAGGKLSAGGAWSEVVEIKPLFHKVLPPIWAQVKAQELDDEARMLERADRTALKNIVGELSKEYGLCNSCMSPVVLKSPDPEPKFGPAFEPWRWIKAIERATLSAKPANELLEDQRSQVDLKGARTKKIMGRGLRMKETLGSKNAPAIFGSKLGHENKLSSRVKEGLFSKPILDREGGMEPRPALRGPSREGPPSAERPVAGVGTGSRNGYGEEYASEVLDSAAVSQSAIGSSGAATLDPPVGDTSSSERYDSPEEIGPAASSGGGFRPVIRPTSALESGGGFDEDPDEELNEGLNDGLDDEFEERPSVQPPPSEEEPPRQLPARPVISAPKFEEFDEESIEQEESQETPAEESVAEYEDFGGGRPTSPTGTPVIGASPPSAPEQSPRPVALRQRDPGMAGGFGSSRPRVSPPSPEPAPPAPVGQASAPAAASADHTPSAPSLPTPRELAAQVSPASRQGPPEVQAREALKRDPVFRKTLMAEMKQLHLALSRTNDAALLERLTDGVLLRLAEVAPAAELLVRAYALGYQSRDLLQGDLLEAKKKLAFWLSRFAKLF